MIAFRRDTQDAGGPLTRPGEDRPVVAAASRKDPARLYLGCALILAVFAFLVTLAFHSVADGDLWAKLALGASVWEGAPGGLPDHDLFAFTPTLPRYVDHEWG